MLGVGGLATLQFITSDLSASTFTLSSFLIVGTRALPSILRIQSASNTIAGSQGSSIYLRQMLQDIEMHPLVSVPDDFRILSSSEFEPTIIVENLSFTYEDATIPALKIDRLKLDAGERLAIVGPSGSGKSTLADLLLGVLEPQYGHVSISGKFPREVVRAWPGKVSYVPQSLSLLDGSIFQNIALFQDSSTEAVSKVWTCLEKAQLGPYVSSLPKGLDTEIGERGIKLSGGQKQRIALARALFTDPELIILDEATSALDAQTEDLVRIAINNLGKDVSIVVIAHRLSTIRDFQRILYLNSGIILADGSFDEVRSIIPQFEQQAKLSGLD
jgi:ATP-binding cassette subfamily C protein